MANNLKDCSFIDFAVALLVPQPLKYKFLSKKGKAVVEHNALAGNLEIFSGTGASHYEEAHGQSDQALKQVYSQAAITKRFFENCLKPGRRLLEIGSGPGFFSSLLLSRCEEAVLNDLSPDMLETNKKNRTQAEQKKISAYMAGPIDTLCRDLRAAHQTFDRIVSISTLHHLEYRTEQVKDLWTVLAPGGQFLFVEPTHNLVRIVRLIKKLLWTYRAPYIPSTHDFLTRQEIVQWEKELSPGKAHLTSLSHTQFKGLHKIFSSEEKYRAWDRRLNKLPGVRTLGNMVYAVLEKAPQ